MSAPTYYRLPRISRTPSPPKEYLRRRQEMGGASLPPMPEGDCCHAEPHSNTDTPDPEVLRPKKKRRAVGTLRVKQKVKNGPVGWDRIHSDVEDDGEILDSITVKGAVLNVDLNPARDPAIKHKVVSQRIKSRRQSVTQASMADIGQAATDVGGPLEAQGDTQMEVEAQVIPPQLEEPARLVAQQSKSSLAPNTAHAPLTPVPSSSTPTHTPVKTTAQRKTVRYVRPYQTPVATATPPLALPATPTPTTTEGGAHPENQAAPTTPPPQTPLLQAYPPQRPSPQTPPPQTPPPQTHPPQTSAATPEEQLQQEQQKAMDVDESTELLSNSSHSAASTAEIQNNTQMSPSPETVSTTPDSSPTSISQFVHPTTPNEAEGSPSPVDFVFNIIRTGASTSLPLTDRPFKVYGRDFIRSGRWMWQQLITTIKDRTHFDSCHDEILLNWVIPLSNIEMLRDQGKEMKRMLENEIIVIRTTGEGHWPEWIYDRMKERRRAWKRERERERQERERRESEQRERREAEERAAGAGSQDTTDAPVEDQDGMLDVVAETQEPMNPAPEATTQEDADIPNTVEEVAENSEGSSKIEVSQEIGIAVSKVRDTLVRTEVADTLPLLEDEAVAPEIAESQETNDVSQALVEKVSDTPMKTASQATFTPVNKPQGQNVALSPGTSSIQPTCASAVSPQTTAVTSITVTASAENVLPQKISMPTTPVFNTTLAALTTTSMQPQSSVANGVPSTKVTPPPRPPPQYRGRPIPMPPAYNRPANRPTRPSLGAVPLVPGASINGNASVPGQTATSPKTTPTIPKTAIATGQRISVGATTQHAATKPSPASTVTTITTGTAITTPAIASSSKVRAGSAELPPAVAAAAQTPLAKWLAKQGGPTVLPKAVQKAVKESNLNSKNKRLGRPIRKSMLAALVGQTTPKQQEAAIRPRPDQAAVAQQAPIPSQRQLLIPPGITAPYSDIASESSSALSSYPSSITSTTSSTTSVHPMRSAASTPANALPVPLTNMTQLSSLTQVHPPTSSTATSSLSPAPSSASEDPTRPPVTSVRAFPAVPTTISATQTPLRTSKLPAYTDDSDSDLDLNLDLHLAPRPKKETRVPSWVKSKTPVAKGRLSLTGKLDDFGSSTSIPTTPAAARAIRTFGGTGRATWGCEMPILDSPEVTQKKEKEVVVEYGHDSMDEDDDDMDMGLDLHRGTKRPRDSMSTNLSPGTNGKSKSNSFDLMGFTSGSVGKDTMMGGLHVGSLVSGSQMLGMKNKSKSKRVRREVDFGDDGDDEEGFLSWEGGTEGGEAVEDEDLDLGF
ncbi:hypothetical protein BGX38DRAFT_1147143 [Terfezia claveryi]|nr:hypothetical protein BGX38DRAFT_1147143 [Terfezia claveryi]